MITRREIRDHLKEIPGQRRTVEQLIVELWDQVTPHEAAQYYGSTGRRATSREQVLGAHERLKDDDAAKQVWRGRRAIIRDRLRELVRQGYIRAKQCPISKRYSEYRWTKSCKEMSKTVK